MKSPLNQGFKEDPLRGQLRIDRMVGVDQGSQGCDERLCKEGIIGISHMRPPLAAFAVGAIYSSGTARV